MGSKGQIIDPNGVLPLLPDNDVTEFRVAIFGSDDEHCDMPAAANDGNIAGVVQESTTEASGLRANVARKGILNVLMKGAGDPGDAVVIATSIGDVQTVATLNPSDHDVINVVGYLVETGVDGKRVRVDMNIHQYVHMEA